MKNEKLNIIETLDKVKSRLTSLKEEEIEINEEVIETVKIRKPICAKSDGLLDLEFLYDEEIEVVDYCDCYDCDCNKEEALNNLPYFEEESSIEALSLIEDTSTLLQSLTEKAEFANKLLSKLNNYQELLDERNRELELAAEELSKIANEIEIQIIENGQVKKKTIFVKGRKTR